MACTLKRISKVNPVTQACGAYRFGIQLVSVLRQNLLHASLFCVRNKAETPDWKKKKHQEGESRVARVSGCSTVGGGSGGGGHRKNNLQGRGIGKGIP